MSGMKRNGGEDGLCSTCIQDASCVIKNGRPVGRIFCEEFIAGEGEKWKPPVKAGGPGRVAETVSGTDAKLNGLCRDCELRADCTFSKRDAGVWHCEEYR